MGAYLDRYNAIKAAIDAKIAGGAVEDYSLPSGGSFRTTPLEKLFDLEQKAYAQAVAAGEVDGQRRVRLARTRPRA